MNKALERQLISWLTAQKKPAQFWIRTTMLCGAFSALLMIFQAGIVAYFLQKIFIDKATLPTAWLPLTSLALLSLARGFFTWLREYAGQRAGETVRRELRAELLETLTHTGPVWTRQKQAGQWASLLFEHVEKLHDYYAKYLPQKTLVACIPLLILVVVFPLNWASGLILALTFPLLPVFMILVGKNAASANQKNFTALSNLSGYFLDRLRGLPTLTHFYQAKAQTQHIETACEQLRLRTMEVLRLAFLSSAVLEFFTALCIALVAVYFGFSYLGHLHFGTYGSDVTLFTGLFVLMLAPEFYAPMRELGTHYHAKAQATAAAQELAELSKKAPKPELHPTQVIPLKTVALCAQDLIVHTQDGTQLLGPLNFTVKNGESIGIMGISGSGKSTFLQTLMGFYPYEGSLTINGTELRSLDHDYWLQHLGWLGQDPQLIYGSIRDNVTLGAAISDKDIIAALKRSQAWEFVSEKGLEYPIGDNNSGLSVGQAQRLALTRLQLKAHKILLLDEPTASLDTQTSAALMPELTSMMAQCTSFCITHNPDQTQSCTQVWIFDGGRITEKTTFADLDPKNACTQVKTHA